MSYAKVDMIRICLILFTYQTFCFAEDLVTIGSAVKSYTKASHFLELKWALSEKSYNQDEVFLTVHSGNISVAKIYRKRNQKLELLKTVTSPTSACIEKPAIHWINHENGRNQIIILKTRYYGTGNLSRLDIFLMEAFADLRYVKYVIDYKELKQKYLKSNQNFWKGPMYDFSFYPFQFYISIYNPEDGNCCPSGGAFHGELFLEKRKDRKNSFALEIKNTFLEPPQ